MAEEDITTTTETSNNIHQDHPTQPQWSEDSLRSAFLAVRQEIESMRLEEEGEEEGEEGEEERDEAEEPEFLSESQSKDTK